MPVIPVLERQRKETHHKFKVTLVYLVSLKPAWVTEQDFISKNKQTKL